MSKFKVGQHVRIVGRHAAWYGERGEVVEMSDSFAFPYTVEVYGHVPLNYSDTELAMVDAAVDSHEANCPWCKLEPLPPTTADLVAANNAEFVARLDRNQAEKEAVKVTPVPVRAQILRTAEKLIRGQRAKDYGEPQENFGRIADLWNAQFGRKLNAPFTAGDVALALVHLKLSRLANTPDHEDSFTDACGYLALGAEIAEGL